MRLAIPFVYLLATFTAAPARAKTPAQVPLLDAETYDNWDLDARPNPNSTGQFIFEGLASLMQHWSHTRYRNGHNLIPGTIPPNTLLYHGRVDQQLPDRPQWVAMDPEHSLRFCAQTCWQLTLVTTRELKVLYFDGSSGAKMRSGTMDTQDVVLWGEVKPEWAYRE
ncbi:hypothetical protein HGRIS_014034 [Hohenbuehelia grisea]|uniref:Uncharacterized protein n=1 Tax=Hohenbuehelia grisea TaxID=104357 RepID=A0ABR3JTT6_9AGAR